MTGFFQWSGGAVRLIEPITDPIIRSREWGHLEKDEYTLPFGPWATAEDPASAPWVWRYGVAAAGTGSSYEALATRVHADVAARLGGPVVVTLLSPWSAAHAFAATGHLHETYVLEKLGRSVPRHPDDIRAVTTLVRILLDRQDATTTEGAGA